MRASRAWQSIGHEHDTTESGQIRPAGLAGRPRLQQFRPADGPRKLDQGHPQGARCRDHAVRYGRRLWRPRRLGNRAGTGAGRAAQGHRACLEIRHGDGRRRKEGRLAPLHHVRRGGEPASGSGPTGSTSTRCTGPTRSPRSRRRCARSTISCAPARCATSAARTSPPPQMVEAQWAARHLNLNAFISAQDEYSLLKRTLDKENLPDDGALRARPAALFPARLRPAHRQAQARRGGGRHAARDARSSPRCS